MKPAVIILAPLLLSAAFASGAPAAPDKAPEPKPELIWTDANDRRIRARFVGLDHDNVVLTLPNGDKAVVPFSKLSPQSVEQARREAQNLADRKIDAVTNMRFCLIRHGQFTMGSPVNESGRLSNPSPTPVAQNTNQNQPAPALDLEPAHEVVISTDFWLKATEVTWSEWNAVRDRGSNYTDISPGRGGSGPENLPDHPVTDITWLDAVKWCNLKSQLEDKTPAYYTTAECKEEDIFMTGTVPPHVKWDASGYRLPTEAEWEFACRGGRDSGKRAFYSGPISSPCVSPPDSALESVGWYGGNSDGHTHPVGGKGSNPFDLYDMHGNVAEWCWDFAAPLTTDAAKDPRGPETGYYRMFRGGNWADPARCCRSAYRGMLSPLAPSSFLVGFRPAYRSDPKDRANGAK